jgi:hypothetical protein
MVVFLIFCCLAYDRSRHYHHPHHHHSPLIFERHQSLADHLPMNDRDMGNEVDKAHSCSG